MKINCMELLRKSGKMVKAGGGSTNMTKEKVSRFSKVQMEESTMVSLRMVCPTDMQL
jgi:hypothetical protein